MKKTLYLRKANDDLISHCKCEKATALIASPGQLDCPWCGCGWMFACSHCNKAFIFAEAFECDASWEQIAEKSMPHSDRKRTPDEVDEWIGFMKVFLKGAKPGRKYVYFDGWIIPTSAEAVHIDGWHSRHDLDFLPHVAALTGQCPIDKILGNRGYWQATRVEDEEE